MWATKSSRDMNQMTQNGSQNDSIWTKCPKWVTLMIEERTQMTSIDLKINHSLLSSLNFCILTYSSLYIIIKYYIQILFFNFLLIMVSLKFMQLSKLVMRIAKCLKNIKTSSVSLSCNKFYKWEAMEFYGLVAFAF